MLKKVLAISGRPGLYNYVSRGNNMLIVESIDSAHKRQPVYSHEQVVSLADISIYTNDDSEVPLWTVLENARKEYEGKAVDLHPKKASQKDIVTFFAKILPNYDTDRVRESDMRKLLSWYNLLVQNGFTDFSEKEETE